MIDASEVLDHIYAAERAMVATQHPELADLIEAVRDLYVKVEHEIGALNLRTCEVVCQRCQAAPATEGWNNGAVDPQDYEEAELCADCLSSVEFDSWARRHPGEAARLAELEGG